jgi:hypothetical protein
MVATLALACGWALAGTPAALAASPAPSPAPSDETPSGEDAAQPELATFGLAAASGDRPDQRGWIELTAAAGSVIYDRVAVVNQSNQPLSLDVYSADAQNSADGSLGLPDRTVAPTDAGSWIAIGTTKVDVPPQSAAGVGYTILPVAITIPADAEPGEHVAGVVASLTAKGSATNGQQTTDVNLEQRVGLRFYVTVAGDLHPGLRVSGVRATYHPASTYGLAGLGSATVTYTLTNTGNTRVGVQATASASGVFGIGKASANGPQVEELLPKSSVTQTVEIPSVWPLVLDYVQVTAKVTLPGAEPRDAGIGTPSSSAWMWAIPWPYLALIALVALAWWWLRRRAERRSGRGRHSHGAPPAPSSSLHATGREPVTAQSRPVP